jgi:hypothetical protein
LSVDSDGGSATTSSGNSTPSHRSSRPSPDVTPSPPHHGDGELVVPGHGLFVTRLTGYLTAILEAYEK